MNISTGGPQILLFERDQQLATLLTSELQLAGYGCQTARTAVEVFDAMARHPIKLVLVNLAQAAAARREFWVALDTQRRGRGIQVFTFHCINIASYGPRELEEFASHMTADMEVDGMPGIMGLVGAIQARLPSSAVTSMSQIGSIRPTPPPSARPSRPPAFTSNVSFQGDAATRPSSPPPSLRSIAQNHHNNFAEAPAQPGPPPGSNTGGLHTYSEKIRAVLYPNQRSWSTGGTFTQPTEQKTSNDIQHQNRPGGSPQPAPTPFTSPTSAIGNGQPLQVPPFPTPPTTNGLASSTAPNPLTPGNTSLLQRLANGEESSLSQLSRLVQERRTALGYAQAPPSHTANTAPLSAPSHATNGLSMPASISSNHDYTAHNSTPVAEPLNIMRPAPIQDLPTTRAMPPTQETARQPEMPTRNHQSRQIEPPVQAPSPTAPAHPPLAFSSNVRAASAPLPMEDSPTIPFKEMLHVNENGPEVVNTPGQQRMGRASSSPQNGLPGTEPRLTGQFVNEVDRDDAPIEQIQKEQNPGMITDTSALTNNAILIDILQSLPPMPALPPQPKPEPAVLNGRAMRTLGSVIQAGHLVPEDRLDVIQQIQRMLSGVDLNYQLGEILLMFKLLTPDQLMAASLVSYGLINTTQISALGRIRQDLHAIGLEYDLENLLIMFRILTPEQLREIKSSWQG